MTECLCPCCVSNPSPTYTPQFRLESEAKWVLALPQYERQDYLNLVEKKRGKPARDILDAWMMEVWTRSRAA